MNAPAPSAAPRGSFKSLTIVLLLVVGGMQAWNWWRDEQAAAALQRLAKAHDITLYTTSSCPFCARAASWLNARAIAWRECNVETDPACMRQYEAQGAPGVPLVHARGHWHLGFDPVWLAQVLDLPAAAGAAARAQSKPSLASSPRP